MQRIKESDILNTILSYLTLKGVFHYRQNSGGFKNPQGGFYRFGALGAPDIIAVVKGRYIGIECKTPAGRLILHQKEFQRKLERAGGMYVVVRSLGDIMKIGL